MASVDRRNIIVDSVKPLFETMTLKGVEAW